MASYARSLGTMEKEYKRELVSGIEIFKSKNFGDECLLDIQMKRGHLKKTPFGPN